jgi:hypothetical protein
MDKVFLTVVALLMVACETLTDGSYMPSEAIQATHNPSLLNCRQGVPICRSSPGRLRTTYRMCACDYVQDIAAPF